VSDAPAGTSFVQVSAGGNVSAALDRDGRVHCWGYDGWGFVSNAPTESGFIQVDVGRAFGAALRADGAIIAWGDNGWGQVSEAPTGKGFQCVDAGPDWAFALDQTGEIHAWPSPRSGTPPAGSFSGGQVGPTGLHGLVLDPMGKIVGWGNDAFGQISGAPSSVGWIAVASGYQHSLATRADGSLYSWGIDISGSVSGTPSGMGFSSIGSGNHFSAAILGPDPDTDDDGLLDSAELHSIGSNPALFDSDGDGLGDGLELGVDYSSAPVGTSFRVFLPDMDPASTTDPLRSDSDGGGLSDGLEDFNADGVYQFGEFDPNSPDDDRFEISVPPLVRGSTVTISVSGARAGSTGAVLYSLAGPGPWTVFDGLEIALTPPIKQAAVGLLLGGSADFQVDVPLAAPVGLTVWIQAVERLFYSENYRASAAWAGAVL
jgi:alpha-tubulin suppressor-like RCC1 family protein